jgi:hypothetical protein
VLAVQWAWNVLLRHHPRSWVWAPVPDAAMLGIREIVALFCSSLMAKHCL